MSDSLFSNVVTLLGFEGANNATSTTDESLTPHTYTFLSGAKISTAQKPFGTSSLLLNGSSDYIRTPDSTDFNLGSGSFTVEMFIRPTSVSGTQFLCGQWLNSGDLGWILYQNGSQLALNVSTTGSDNNVQMSGGTLSAATWQHVAIDFDGSKYRAFIAGVMVASSTTLRTIFNSPDNFSIGSNSTGSSFFFGGNIKELRITKGASRYGSDTSFTPPSGPFPRAVTITSVTANSGSTAGGTSVTITGTDMTGTTDVKFGGTSATSIVVVNDTTITCVTPAHAAGAVNVQLFNPSNNPTLVNGFTYVTAITKDVVLDYAIHLAKDLILDYAIDAFVTKDLILDYKIHLTKSLTLDYAIPSDNFDFFDWRPDRTTVFEFQSDYDLTATSIDTGLFAVPGTATPPDVTPGPDQTAFFVDAFYGDFYLRIWMDPPRRVLNNPRIGSPIPFNVWNAFPSSNNLVEVLFTDLTGVEADFTLPMAFARYEYKVLNFIITADAPPELNGFIDFIFDQGSAELNLIATVVALLRALPEEPITETWRWATALNISKSSVEQRAGLRYRPRYLVTYPTFLNADEGRRAYYGQLWMYLSRPVRVPMFQYAVELDAPSASGTSKLYFDPMRTDMRSDEYLTIFNPHDSTFLIVKPVSIDVDGATLDNPLEVDIAAYCKAIPTINMRLAPASGLSMDAVNGTATVSAESVTGRDLLRPGSTPTITTFDGLLVVPEVPVVLASANESFDQNTETIDNGTVNPVPYTFWPMPFATMSKQYRMEPETDLTYWQKIGDEIVGSRIPFLVPTWRKDLFLYETPTLGSSTIRVTNTDYPDMAANDGYARLQFKNDNGVEYHTVVSAVDSGAGYVDIVLGEGIGVDTGDNNIERISFLNLCRLADDSITLSHYVGYSLVGMNIRVVNE